MGLWPSEVVVAVAAADQAAAHGSNKGLCPEGGCGGGCDRRTAVASVASHLGPHRRRHGETQAGRPTYTFKIQIFDAQ